MTRPTLRVYCCRQCRFKCGVCGKVKYQTRGWGKIRDGIRFTYYVCASCIEAGPGNIQAQWRQIAERLRGEGSDGWADHFESLARSLGDSDAWLRVTSAARLRPVYCHPSFPSDHVHRAARPARIVGSTYHLPASMSRHGSITQRPSSAASHLSTRRRSHDPFCSASRLPAISQKQCQSSK